MLTMVTPMVFNERPLSSDTAMTTLTSTMPETSSGVTSPCRKRGIDHGLSKRAGPARSAIHSPPRAHSAETEGDSRADAPCLTRPYVDPQIPAPTIDLGFSASGPTAVTDSVVRSW
jgi:hypothetical protein